MQHQGILIRIENGEVFVYGMHISPYEKGNIFNKDPLRVRKLLLHKQEINKLLGKMKEKGMTLVPLKVYLKGSLVRWRSAWQKERNCMTRGRTLPKKTRQEKHERDFKIRNFGVDSKEKEGIIEMVPVTKKDLRNLVSQTTIETYEELTPQLIQLIDMTKKNPDLTDAQKSDEISLHMIGYVKSCTNEIIIEVLSEILGLEDEE